MNRSNGPSSSAPLPSGPIPCAEQAIGAYADERTDSEREAFIDAGGIAALSLAAHGHIRNSARMCRTALGNFNICDIARAERMLKVTAAPMSAPSPNVAYFSPTTTVATASSTGKLQGVDASPGTVGGGAENTNAACSALSGAVATAARRFLAEECARRIGRQRRQSKLLRQSAVAARQAGCNGTADLSLTTTEIDAQKRRRKLAEWEADMQEKQLEIREQLAEKKQLQEANRRRRTEEQAKKEEDAHRLKMIALEMKLKARRLRLREEEQRHKNRAVVHKRQIEDETVRRRQLCESAVRQWRIQKDRQSRQARISAANEKRMEQRRGQELLEQMRRELQIHVARKSVQKPRLAKAKNGRPAKSYHDDEDGYYSDEIDTELHLTPSFPPLALQKSVELHSKPLEIVQGAGAFVLQ